MGKIQEKYVLEDTYKIGKIQVENITDEYFLMWFTSFVKNNKKNVINPKYHNIFMAKRNDDEIYRLMSIGLFYGFKILASKEKLLVQIIKFNQVINEYDLTNQNYITSPYSEVFKACSQMQKRIKKELSEEFHKLPFVGGCKNMKIDHELKEIAMFYLPEILLCGVDEEFDYFSTGCEYNLDYEDIVLEKKKNYKISKNYFPQKDQYIKKLSKIIDSFEKNGIEKIVVSKKCEINTEEEIDVLDIAKYLMDTYFQQYFYMFEMNDNQTWIGVSPEVLLTDNDDYFISKPLAATFAKGNSKEENAIIRRDLLNNQKEVMEHNIVVQLMLDDIKKMNVGQVRLDEEREILETPYVFHLKSQICVEKAEEVTGFDILSCIYPPATIWGTPREKCSKYIYEMEDFDRGYFTGTYGVFNLEGFSEFALVIRSGILEQNKISVFAGSGIVKLSDCEKEWNETDIKMDPFFKYFN